MKIRALREAQARRSWERLVDLTARGYVFLIKRGGKAIARLERLRPTISSRTVAKEH